MQSDYTTAEYTAKHHFIQNEQLTLVVATDFIDGISLHPKGIIELLYCLKDEEGGKESKNLKKCFLLLCHPQTSRQTPLGEVGHYYVYFFGLFKSN